MLLVVEKVIVFLSYIFLDKTFYLRIIESVLKSHLARRFPDCLFEVRSLFPPISAMETSCQIQNCSTRVRLEFKNETNLACWYWTGQPCHEVKNHHLAIHKSSYSCLGCGKKFKLKVKLTEHQNKCSNGIRSKCEKCDKIFVSQRNLNNHIQVVHSLNAEEKK